jgi:uncharacterized protein (DUF2249 family)
MHDASIAPSAREPSGGKARLPAIPCCKRGAAPKGAGSAQGSREPAPLAQNVRIRPGFASRPPGETAADTRDRWWHSLCRPKFEFEEKEAAMSFAVDVPDLLDCRRLGPDAGPDVVLDAFDALAPGRRFRLVCAQAPVSALDALRRERPGAFEWSPVREGPVTWEVDVERRAAPVGSRREVTEALVWDHARLDALEAAAFEARARGALSRARDLFTDFARGLRRHIEFEEQLLFPEFEKRCHLEGENGPSAVMRAEHRTITSLLFVMEREIDDP